MSFVFKSSFHFCPIISTSREYIKYYYLQIGFTVYIKYYYLQTGFTVYFLVMPILGMCCIKELYLDLPYIIT